MHTLMTETLALIMAAIAATIEAKLPQGEWYEAVPPEGWTGLGRALRARVGGVMWEIQEVYSLEDGIAIFCKSDKGRQVVALWGPSVGDVLLSGQEAVPKLLRLCDEAIKEMEVQTSLHVTVEVK